MRKYIVAFLLIAVISSGFWSITRQAPKNTPMPIVSATIAGKTFRLHAPQTLEQRQTGLAAFNSIADDEGMIFRGIRPGVQSFWMKNMKFDIDILWVDANNQIVHIVQAVSKDSYPKTVQNPSSKPSSYVIELQAETCLRYGITSGQTVNLH